MICDDCGESDDYEVDDIDDDDNLESERTMMMLMFV